MTSTILLVAPPVTHDAASPAPGVPVTPTPLPPDGTATYTVQVRVDDVLMATFAHPEVEAADEVRHGAGTMTVRWSTLPELEPAAAHMVDGGGDLKTWDTARIELWLLRQDALVWCGPVTRHRVHPDTDTVTTTARTRYRHVERAILGVRERTNLLPQGYFDASLSGWTVMPGVTATSVTSPAWRRPRSARLRCADVTGAPGITAGFTLTTIGAHPNYVDVGIAALLERGGTLPYGIVAGRVQHAVTPEEDPTGTAYAIVEEDTKHLMYPDGYQPGTWERLTVRMPQWPGVRNHYSVRLFAATTRPGFATSGPPPAHVVGEAEGFRDTNASARAGWDLATFLAAVLDDTCSYMNEAGGPRWGRSVTSLGITLHDHMRELHRDHVDVRTILEDAVRRGVCDIWVPTGTRTVCVRPRRGSDAPVLTLRPGNAAGLELELNAEEAMTAVVALADGQDGPTREEGLSFAPALPGAVLHEVVTAQPGSLPVDLDREADDVRRARGGATVSATGTPTDGPDAALPFHGHPGALVHTRQPGDAVTVDAATGVYAPAVKPVVRIETLRVRPLNDTVELDTAEAHRTVG